MTELTEPLVAPPPEESIPICGFCSTNYYRQFFNVTTSEVLEKAVCALVVFRFHRFNELCARGTDFYGPFWIYATIVFSLAVSQNLFSLLTKPEHTRLVYTIDYVPKAFGIVYVFGVFVPVFFTFILKTMGTNISFLKTILIYGYSQCINIFLLLACAYPNSSSQSFFITWGAVQSSAFVYLCLKDELRNSEGSLQKVAIGVMSAIQFVLVIIYKRFFFGDLYKANYYA